MQRFFIDFASIDQFTLSLDYHQNTFKCCHCHKQGQFVSHGVVYKQLSMKVREPVGKRIICSKRDGRSGCGRTLQLYIASVIPNLHYRACHLFAFVVALCYTSVCSAWQRATQQHEPRNGWRWINKLNRQLSQFRARLKTPDYPLYNLLSNHPGRSVLLATLTQVFTPTAGCPCAAWQLQHQTALLSI